MRYLLLIGGLAASGGAHANVRYYKCLGVLGSSESTPQTLVMVRGSIDSAEGVTHRGPMSVRGHDLDPNAGIPEDRFGTRERPLRIPATDVAASFDHPKNTLRLDGQRADGAKIHIQRVNFKSEMVATVKNNEDDEFSALSGPAECRFTDEDSGDWSWSEEARGWPND